MKRKIYVSIWALIIVTTLSTMFLTLFTSYNLLSKQIKNDIRQEGEILVNVLNLTDKQENFLRQVKGDKRITLVDISGNVIFDNVVESGLENHANRPEIADARLYGVGEDVRYSDTLQRENYYFGVLLKNGNVLRLSYETKSVFSMFTSTFPLVAAAILIIFALCQILIKKFVNGIVKPIENVDLSNVDTTGIYEEFSPFLMRITAQNQQIRGQMEIIENQKERLATITDNMSEGLIILEKNGDILTMNKKAKKIFDFEEQKSFLELTRDLQLYKCVEYAQKSQTGAEIVIINNVKYKVMYSAVIDGEIVGLVLIFLDISMEEEGERLRREFSANVSHELKTPLTSILGYSELIAEKIATPDDMPDFGKKIQKEATRLLSLIQDIIKLSGLDENYTVEFENINMENIAKDVVQSLSERSKSKGVTIKISGVNPENLKGNANMVYELIYNLIDNAIRYNKVGGTVDVVLSPSSFSVKDTGIGIAPEYQSHVFERFFRVDKHRSKESGGTGLGLSIVKHIALTHKWAANINSNIGEGTEIIVTF